MKRNRFIKTLLFALAIMFLPMNVHAATTGFEDSADCFSDSEQENLQNLVDEICGELPIAVHYLTNNEDLDETTTEYLEKHIAEEAGTFDIGFMFDFKNSEYSIVAAGDALKYLSNDDIEDAYELCDKKLKDSGSTLYDCAKIMTQHCLEKIVNSYNGDIAIDEEITAAVETVAAISDVDSIDATVVDVTTNNARVIIHDLAELLEKQDELSLLNFVKANYSDLRYNILFLTTNDTKGKTTMAYSNDYMDLIFPPGTENNIAFVIDMENREIYIKTMGMAIESLSDIEIGKALDLGYDRITKQDYHGTMQVMSEYCLNRLKNPKTNGEAFLFGFKQALIPSVIITVIVCVVLILNHKKANQAVKSTHYMSAEDYKVVGKREKHVRSYDTVQRGYYASSSSSGGSSHSSSSGRSHGGGGRRF